MVSEAATAPDVAPPPGWQIERHLATGGTAHVFVVRHATTYELQARCVAALIRKTEILWHLLDSLYTVYVEPGWGPGGARA